MSSREITCAHCGTKFERRSDKGRKPKFCSPRCARESWRKANPERVAVLKARYAARPPRPERVRTCARCGTEFVARTQNGRLVGKYCSPQCVGVTQRNGHERACLHCGKSFYAQQAQINARGARFCSRSCATSYNKPATRPEVRAKISAARLGAKDGRYRHGLNPKTVKRDVSLAIKGEDCCRNCGSTHYLHLHHVIPRSMWSDGIREIMNCIPLCARCHMGWHHRWLTIHRDIFTPAEWDCISSADLLGQNVEAWLGRRYPRRESNTEARRAA